MEPLTSHALTPFTGLLFNGEALLTHVEGVIRVSEDDPSRFFGSFLGPSTVLNLARADYYGCLRLEVDGRLGIGIEVTNTGWAGPAMKARFVSLRTLPRFTRIRWTSFDTPSTAR